MNLTVAQSFQLAAVAAVVALLLRPRLPGTSRWAAQVVVIVGLYGSWQIGLDLGVRRTTGAVEQGTRVWDVERALHLPSEATLQRLVLDVPGLMHGFDLYYALVHFAAMGALLVWLFALHRSRYGPFVLTLSLVTGAAMLIQYVPVAPPRLIPSLGVADAPAALGDSVYPPGGLADPGQLIAMPSVHVAWALLVAIAVIRASRHPRRWLVLAHPVLTVLAVTASGNHYWLDGAVAAGLIALALTGQALSSQALARRRSRTASGSRRTVEGWTSTTPARS